MNAVNRTKRWPGKSSFSMKHQPVMVNQVVELLSGCPDGLFIDATVGTGGHLIEVYKAHGRRFKYIGFDLDSLALKQAKHDVTEIGLEAELIKSSYTEIAGHLQKRKISSISAVLYDLGIGSFQIDNPNRGFSYLGDGPLSMSFDDDEKLAAANIIDSLNENELTRLLKSFGQERKARSLSKAIKGCPDKIITTGQLAQIIRSVVGSRSFIKTASRVFQAVRIKVNDEFENIRKSLETVLPCLAPGGMAMVITYHSLEDGHVKRVLKKYSGKCVCPSGMPECRCGKQKLVRPVYSKPVKPSPEEIAVNSRARSAKLRVVERIENES